MDGRRLILGLMLLLGTTSVAAQSISGNMDKKTLEAVLDNTTHVIGLEERYNVSLKDEESKQKRVAKLAGAIAAAKTLYSQTLENIQGFDEETRMYKDIYESATRIAQLLPKAGIELAKRPYSLLACTKDIVSLATEATNALKVFANIVNNGKVSIKIGDLDSSGSDDANNLLNRSDRYYMATLALRNLQEVQWELEALVSMAEYCNSISDVIRTIDIDTWCNAMYALDLASGVIEDFNNL